jgi:hypothetical protein
MEPRKPALWDAVSVGDELPEFARTPDLANGNRTPALNDEFIPLHTGAPS